MGLIESILLGNGDVRLDARAFPVRLRYGIDCPSCRNPYQKVTRCNLVSSGMGTTTRRLPDDSGPL